MRRVAGNKILRVDLSKPHSKLKTEPILLLPVASYYLFPSHQILSLTTFSGSELFATQKRETASGSLLSIHLQMYAWKYT